MMRQLRPSRICLLSSPALGLCALAILATAAHRSQAPARQPLENLVFVEPDVISGSAPLDEAAFEQLATLSVRTIISVEAFPPDVQTAGRYGLRYVHLPIGYDGMTSDDLLRLAYALRTAPRPIYVHCFHGRHRSPAAVAAAEVVLGRLSVRQAERVLEAAGTSPSYPGLFAALDLAARLDPQWLACAAGPLPERVEPEPFLLAMGRIDRTWNTLWGGRQRQWKLAGADAATFASDADALAEQFRTAATHVPQRWRRESIVQQLASAAQRAARLGEALRTGRLSAASDHADRLRASCRRCHADTRNRLPMP